MSHLIVPIICYSMWMTYLYIACKKIEEINKMKPLLQSNFKMKDLGPIGKILRIEITRNRDI